MTKKGEFKPKGKMTKEALKLNRQQKKKELKKNRQQAERKDMFQIICQAKQMWGDLRRCAHTHTKSENESTGTTDYNLVLEDSPQTLL